jgi:hypothetical protein
MGGTTIYLVENIVLPIISLKTNKETMELDNGSSNSIILNALGICRKFPRSLVFAPIQYLGLGIIHLHMIQEISRLMDLITRTADMTITGSLYRASLEVFLIEMGISTDLDSIPFDKMHFLSSDAFIKKFLGISLFI